MPKEMGSLVINGLGEEKKIYAPVQPAVIPEKNIIFTSDKKKVEVSWRSNFKEMDTVKKSYEGMTPFQSETHVDTKSLAEYPDMPYLVWWASDMHIGHVDTDYTLLRKHIELAENTPNVGIVSVGDDIDYGVLGKFINRFIQTMSPQGQIFTAEDLMAELNGRNPRDKQLILCHLMGNHTQTLMELSGVVYESFYRQSKAAILPGRGEMFLQVGEQNYEVALAHKYTGRSRLNITLEPKRLMDFEFPSADIAVVGDMHKAGYEKFFKGGKERLAIRPGTYKVGENLFEKNRGYGQADLGGSCTLFYPDKHKMLPFDKLEDGVEYLNALMVVKGHA